MVVWFLMSFSMVADGQGAGGVETGFLQKTIKDETGEHKYGLFIPRGYTADQRWPVILFLHGAGERGKDGQKQLKVGLAPAIRKREQSFPAIAIFPQCEDSKIAAANGWIASNANGRRAIAILDEVMKTYSTDPGRVYLTGLSMGGFGAWSLAATFPDRWAALVPICGGGKTDWASKIVRIPTWCFHGGADPVVPPHQSRRMVEAVRKAGGNPKYTEYAKVGHKSWEPAYDDDELYRWLFAQKKP